MRLAHRLVTASETLLAPARTTSVISTRYGSFQVTPRSLPFTATPDLDDPSTWEVARSLPTFKDQTNKILANPTNLGAHFGSGRVRPDLSTGVDRKSVG